MRVAKEERKIPFFTKYSKSFIVLLSVTVAVIVLVVYASILHKEMEMINKDGGYQAVSDKKNEFGLPILELKKTK